MKKVLFRSIPIILAIAVGLAFILSGCEAGLIGKLNINMSAELTDIEMAVPGGAGSKSLSHAETDTACVRVFNSSRTQQVIGNRESDYTVNLSWDNVNSRWYGSLNLSAVSGSTIILAYVTNVSGEQIYKASTTKTIDNDTRSQAISLTASTAYSIGDPGPAGGWIYYDKGSYSSSWRYLEAAPSDLSQSWAGLSVDGTVNGDGTVTTTSDGTLLTTDWYWGPNTNSLSTEATRGRGNENTGKLVTADADVTSSVTPRIKKGKGRPIPAATGIVRRKGATTTSDLSVNGKDDWFIPSSEELGEMYTNIKSTSGTGLTTGYYWSSTEDTTLTSGEYSGKYVNFGAGTLSYGVDIRSELHKVRPSRKF